MTVRRIGSTRRWLTVLGAVLVTTASTACAARGEVTSGSGSHAAAAAPAAAPSRSVTAARTPPKIALGRGLVRLPDAARAWVAAHPKDPRTPEIAARIASQPTALWLTGNESFGNLRSIVAMARKTQRTALLTLWNIPFRWDGLSSPTTLSLSAYQAWIKRVAVGIGTTRAIVVLEPDALWFYDRLPTASDRRTRFAALRYAVSRLHKSAPNTRVYLDAGTASGSVTPQRMAQLLLGAGLRSAAGYAVNVSSYAPRAMITAYASKIRTALRHSGVVDPRFVVDTGRNGASSWGYDWCNPTAQRLGSRPKLVRSTSGLDLALWVKAPATSDGDCGAPGRGLGSYGGQFLPAVAYSMLGH